MHPGVNARRPSWLGRVLVAVGISGAALSALCCLAPFLVAGLLTALGLGFIIKDSILLGLIAAFVGVALFGYYLIQRHQHA